MNMSDVEYGRRQGRRYANARLAEKDLELENLRTELIEQGERLRAANDENVRLINDLTEAEYELERLRRSPGFCQVAQGGGKVKTFVAALAAILVAAVVLYVAISYLHFHLA